MKIGIDLSALQGPHRMRGIGFSLINFINNIPQEDLANNFFVFFLFQPNEYDNPLDYLMLNNVNFEVRYYDERIVTNQPINNRKSSLLVFLTRAKNLLIRKTKKIINKMPKRLLGASRAITNLLKSAIYILRPDDPLLRNVTTEDIDIFLEFDPDKKVSSKKMKYAIVLYDIIPYVLEWDYLWSYRTTREKSLSIKSAFRNYLHRLVYIYKFKMNTLRANMLFSISNKTKKDFINYVGIKEKKIIVTALGVNKPTINLSNNVLLHRYSDTPWGYIKRGLKLDKNTIYLLYIGGVDSRRKLEDLVTAFNMLRAQEYNIKLVLAGDIMYAPKAITTEQISRSLQSSSYIDDIIFMGFITNEQRDWLYKNALAFVFPSRYEGFGLPILEAMIQKCPVISYPNEAVVEVAGDNIVYADSPIDIFSNVIKLIKLSGEEKEKITDKAYAHAQQYSWNKTAHNILSHLEKLN